MRLRALTILGLTTALLVAPLVASTAAAQQAQRIAIIDGDRVLTESTIGRNARERIEASANTWQERVNAVRQEFDNLNVQRQEGALTLNEEALASLNLQIEEKQVEIQRLQDDARRELQRLEQQVTVDVNERLGPLVSQLAAQGSYEIIIDASRLVGLLYFSEAIDVTDDFLALVNAAIPAGGAQ